MSSPIKSIKEIQLRGTILGSAKDYSFICDHRTIDSSTKKLRNSFATTNNYLTSILFYGCKSGIMKELEC